MRAKQRRAARAAAVFGLIACTSAPGAAAHAVGGCTIGNSAPVLTNFFSILYVEAVRTQGYCVQDGAPVEELNAPYVCTVFGIANGGIQAPAVLAGAATRDPLENFCSALSDTAVAVEDCQEWYVDGRYTAFWGELGTMASFEFACA